MKLQEFSPYHLLSLRACLAANLEKERIKATQEGSDYRS